MHPYRCKTFYFFLNQLSGFNFSPKFSTFSLTNQPAAKPIMKAIVNMVFSLFSCVDIYRYYQPRINCRISGSRLSGPHWGNMVILTMHFLIPVIDCTAFCMSTGMTSAAGQNAEVKVWRI